MLKNETRGERGEDRAKSEMKEMTDGSTKSRKKITFDKEMVIVSAK